MQKTTKAVLDNFVEALDPESREYLRASLSTAEGNRLTPEASEAALDRILPAQMLQYMLTNHWAYVRALADQGLKEENNDEG